MLFGYLPGGQAYNTSPILGSILDYLAKLKYNNLIAPIFTYCRRTNCAQLI